MFSEIIRLVNSGEIKETKYNNILFGRLKYPESAREAWKQFKKEIWQKSIK
tara:strand:+ start:12737 stop:12889 length:153 start_codon:yes stop_codon:yes gene_type:complete